KLQRWRRRCLQIRRPRAALSRDAQLRQPHKRSLRPERACRKKGRDAWKRGRGDAGKLRRLMKSNTLSSFISFAMVSQKFYQAMPFLLRVTAQSIRHSKSLLL